MYNNKDIRNARFADSTSDLVEFELKHKDLGWIPCSLSLKSQEQGELENIKQLLQGVTIKPFEYSTLSRVLIKNKLENLSVKISTGKIFDANLEARQNLSDAIIAADFLKIKETKWRMFDNSEVVVTLDELKEAHALAILEYAKIKAIL
nr:MAG TPA: protein of unknown function (DUF4376) [Caudoviricetes sp.]